MIGFNSSNRPPLNRSISFLTVISGLFLSVFGFQDAPQKESVFGEYVYYDFMNDYSSLERFTSHERFNRYTSYTLLTLNPDSTYSYFNVYAGREFSTDSGSFSLQKDILTFKSKFGENDLRGNTYYTGPYGSEKANSLIYIDNNEYFELNLCDTNCLNVFFYHNVDSALSYLEFGLGSRDRMVKLQGEFQPNKSYYFKYPRKDWKEEELFTLSVNIPELHYAQQDFDGMRSTLSRVKNHTLDTLIITLTQRKEADFFPHREASASFPQRLHNLKMLWEGESLHPRYLKKPEKKQWVWDRKYCWLQKKKF